MVKMIMYAKGCAHWILIPVLFGFFLLILHYMPSLKIFSLFIALNIGAIFLFSLAIFFAVFFRDPERTIGKGVVAPADGRIMGIYKKSGVIQIATFMALSDVHVNRSPLDGKVISVQRISGGYIPAYDLESEKRNARVSIVLKSKMGAVKIVQIAGIFARRIVTYVEEGQRLKKGERIGIIRFGSRVDLYLPENKVKVLVTPNEKVKAGETPVASVQVVDGV